MQQELTKRGVAREISNEAIETVFVEENVDEESRFTDLLGSLTALRAEYKLPVVVSTLMKVPNGTASLGLITRSSPSSGAYASSSARLISLAAVTTSPPGAI